MEIPIQISIGWGFLGVLLYETLMTEGFNESLAHCLVVFLGVSNIGEYLGEGFLTIDSHELLVFFQCLFLGIEIIYLGGGVVTKSLVMYDGT